MSEKRFIPLNQRTRQFALKAVQSAPDGYCVLIHEPSRTLAQNALAWPLLACFADQLTWPVNGRMEQLTKEDWKDLLSAAFHQEAQRVSPSIGGVGMVLLGERTSAFGKREFSDFIEFIKYQAAEMGVDLETVQAA